MNAQRWKEVQASFDHVVDLDESQRRVHLASLEVTDPELHRALESMLKADDMSSARLAALDFAFLPGLDREKDPLGLAGRTIAHFVVREALGAGGMGVVYRADDTRLGRAVALKFLLPPYNLDASAKTRFLREAKAVAALDHPNLCALHEVGTSDDGWLFLAMALYEGETLRARLAREGNIPLRDAVDIARQIAQGLQAAHFSGIVHRDLKPGNVMLLPDGTLRILDFGLAKARDQSVTETGGAFGTVSFMSPEQILGAKVDGRADLWALGVVLYEMLAGQKPFGGEEEVAIAHAIVHDEPRLPSTHRKEIPAALEGLVLRLLRKDPAKRPVNASELLRELAQIRLVADGTVGMLRTRGRRLARIVTRASRPGSGRLALGIAGFAILTAGYVGLRSSRATAAATSGTAASASPSIAILPFDNVGGDSTNAPFSDGVADDLATQLGKMQRLDVMARTSAFTLKRKGLDAREIGRQLHVQYILEGSVSRSARRRRVRADLMEVATGKELWSEDFDHDALNRDVFTVEDSITRSIVRHLVPHIPSAVLAASVKHRTENREAQGFYFQGRYFFEKRDSASFLKAQEYFRRAIRADSSYALAYAGLADAYSHQTGFGFAPLAGNMAKAKTYLARALALDSTLVEVYPSLAFISLFFDTDFPKARRELETALRLDDKYPTTHLFHAWYYVAVDSPSAAIAEGRRAVELDRYSPLNNTRLVSFLFLGGHYNEALAQAQTTLERDPNYAGLRQELARVYTQLGRCTEALAVLEHTNDQPVGLLRGVRGYTYAKCGKRKQAVAELTRLRREYGGVSYGGGYVLAVIEAGLGEKQQAITDLERSSTEGHLTITIRLDPALASLHSEPRFIALLHRMGLAPPVETPTINDSRAAI